MTSKQLVLLVAGIGFVCALLVYWLQRFEVNRMHEGMAGYLEKWDAFRRWEEQHGAG